MKKDEGLYGIKAERIDYCPFHLSPNLRLLYVLEGSIRLRWVSGEHILKKGEIEIVNINEPVLMQRTDGENLILTFEFDGARAKTYCDIIDKGIFNCNTTLFYSSVTTQKDQEVLKRRLRLIYHYFLQGDCDVLLEKLVKEIVLFICDRCHDLKNMFRNVMTDDVRGERFMRIYTYILENCHEKINLKELAESEYLSPQYLSKEFNDRLKINFKDTLEYFRVIQSVRYLISSRMSLMRISENCGFSALRYFYKHFEHYMNCTPAEFRRLYLEQKERIVPVLVNDSKVAHILDAFEVGQGNGHWQDSLPETGVQWMKLLKEAGTGVGFSAAEIPEQQLEALLDIAFCAPDFGIGHELQVIQVSQRQWKDKLADCWPDREFGRSGAAGFVFCIRKQEEESFQGLLAKTAAASTAAWQLCIGAQAAGLSTQIAAELSCCTDRISALWGLPSCIIPVIAVTVGYPVDRPGPTNVR